MKGIILAGGSGTRLHPITNVISKQILPISDKPMIYYPLSILLLSGIKDILIISTPNDLPIFERLFGNGHHLGINISYEIQQKPEGIAQAFLIGEKFIGNDNVCLVLGDNILFGAGLKNILQKTIKEIEKNKKAYVFGYRVKNPKDYGVVAFDNYNNVTSIDEKPKQPKSDFAVIGLYFYPNSVVNIAKNIKPSNRGELEITSINQEYLKKNTLQLTKIGRGYIWLDTGTHENLNKASNLIRLIEDTTTSKIGCIEEIVFSNGLINKTQLEDILSKGLHNDYSTYLKNLIYKQK